MARYETVLGAVILATDLLVGGVGYANLPKTEPTSASPSSICDLAGDTKLASQADMMKSLKRDAKGALMHQDSQHLQRETDDLRTTTLAYQDSTKKTRSVDIRKDNGENISLAYIASTATEQREDRSITNAVSFSNDGYVSATFKIYDSDKRHVEPCTYTNAPLPSWRGDRPLTEQTFMNLENKLIANGGILFMSPTILPTYKK